jgi:hypothetical protein
MAVENERDEEAIIQAAYEARVRELFMVLAESLATGEDEVRMKERFRRALQSAKKARSLALEAAAEERQRAARG